MKQLTKQQQADLDVINAGGGQDIPQDRQDSLMAVLKENMNDLLEATRTVRSFIK